MRLETETVEADLQGIATESGRGEVPDIAKPKSRTFLNLLLVVLVLGVFASNSLRWSQAGQDPDFWWHLRTGEWVLHNNAVPATDPYAWTTAGKPWVAYHWLFDVLLVKVFATWGQHGITGLITVLSVATMFVLAVILSRYTNLIRALILAGAAEAAMFALRTPRPWLFTILFFTLELWLLLEACERRRPAWLIPIVPLVALWANIHVQFIYGLGLAGLFAIQQTLPAGSKYSFAVDPRGRKLPGLWLWSLLASCLIATLANPYGWRIWTVVMEDVREHVSAAVIQEGQALGFRDFTCWIVLAFVCGACFAMGTLRQRPAFLLILLPISCWFGFREQRELWFPVISSALILAYRSRQGESGRHEVSRSQWAFAAIAVLLITFAEIRSGGRSEADLERGVVEHYPVAAAGFIQAHGASGPIYNGFGWGGYLIWRLRDKPVSIDGRANLHGDERVLRSARTMFAAKAWRADDELRKAGTIILEDDSPLASVLRSDAGYRLLYEDKVAAVFEPK